jgi:hypothetical protein
MKWAVTVVALGLASAAVSADSIETAEDEVDGLGIDVGRLDVINDRTREIWLKLRSDQTKPRGDDPAELSSSLRRIVWSFNDLRDSLCNDRFMVEKSCGPPYLPKWIREPGNVVPTPRQLRERQSQLEDQVVPLWDAVCARLKKVIGADDAMQYCSVE